MKCIFFKNMLVLLSIIKNNHLWWKTACGSVCYIHIAGILTETIKL